MQLLRVLRAVLWSIFGVRRRAEAERDLENAGLGMFIGAGLIIAVLLVAVLSGLALLITHREARPTAERSAAARGTPPKLHGPVRIAGTMEERAQPCTACHGSATHETQDGFSPRIAGKPAGYLFNQLASFRDGRRTYPAMVYLVQYMTDDYLHEIAAYFSRLELPYPPPEASTLTPAQTARARDIVEHGDSANDVPPCVRCHSENLSGLAPAIPSLLGLPRQYMNEQFGAWRAGRLRSVAPDCMAEVARRLAPQDAPLLAAWLAAQPVPAGMKPAGGPRKLPLECGSVQAAHARESSAPAARARGVNEPGRYLVAAGDCIACHTDIGGAPFAGGRAIDTPFGTIYSSNITPDSATGIGRWSRDDFWRALHEGRSRDGRLLYPAFPYPNFTLVSRTDADAMFDYLRALPAVARANTPHALRFPYSTQLALTAWRALFFRAGEFKPEASRSAEWNRGAYLVRGLGHCDACHASRNMFGAVSHRLDLGGGLIPMQKWYAPPLVAGARGQASDMASLLTSGIARSGMAIGPMAEVVYRSTQHLSAEDVRAMSAYLEASRSAVPQRQPAPAASAAALERGAAIYAEHCAQCHGDKGEGAFPAYPPLAGNPSVTAPLAANAIKAVLHGGYAPATAANPRPYGMAPYFDKLNDADVAALLTYVRAEWGNAGAPVSAVDVERYR